MLSEKKVKTRQSSKTIHFCVAKHYPKKEKKKGEEKKNKNTQRKKQNDILFINYIYCVSEFTTKRRCIENLCI